jgi:hypothetical protein|tara:strand:+ start:9348 stop:9449 length:102 start_codon:yes stop_codon:yes gene_type:complete
VPLLFSAAERYLPRAHRAMRDDEEEEKEEEEEQ